MHIKSMIALLLFVAWVSGCSYVSMPSMPWSGAKADPSAEALFDEGMRNFNDKRYVRAIDNFSKLRTDFPFHPQMMQVELKIADAYYLNQQYPEAITAFKEYQSMHPTNEQIPFVTLRLGQSYFDQFSAADRDQKNTEIAKGYFENVITAYPKSPEAAEAREKLAKCLEYLAEHEFNIAEFYFKQEKYPAARDRFEEIVRKYKDTPTAVKSLFYLGESYRNEKNAIRATLAYEALIQHYPKTQFAADAKVQLALVEKEKHDPLALLLMRDRRPSAAPPPEVKEDPALAKLKDLNLVAKTEVVHEEPGAEKGFFSRVATKLNPFSSDSSQKTEEKEPTAVEMLAKRSQAQKKEESSGVLASLWPFGSNSSNGAVAKSDPKTTDAFVSQIDSSLKQKGIDSASPSTVKPPPVALPNTDDMSAQPAKTADVATLLSSVDANLKSGGKDGTALPPAPEMAEGFKDAAVIQAAKAKAAPQPPPQDVQTSGILSSIDQKLKAQGVEPGKLQAAPTPEETRKAVAQKPTNIELEPKLSLEKGPLFLSPANMQAQEKPTSKPETIKPDAVKPDAVDTQDIPSRILVKGPVQPKASTVSTKPSETKVTSAADDPPKGVFDQIRQDMENVSKALSPFSW
jgi:outer membrane protein assembly factor BamD